MSQTIHRWVGPDQCLIASSDLHVQSHQTAELESLYFAPSAITAQKTDLEITEEIDVDRVSAADSVLMMVRWWMAATVSDMEVNRF